MNQAKDSGQFLPELEEESPWEYLTPSQRLDLITDVLAVWALRRTKQEGSKAKNLWPRTFERGP
jgi:hypothetical protein